MLLPEYRRLRRITLAQTAAALGLSPNSRGYLSRVENGHAPCTLQLALQIEALSAGEVDALELLGANDRALLAAAIRRRTDAALA